MKVIKVHGGKWEHVRVIVIHGGIGGIVSLNFKVIKVKVIKVHGGRWEHVRVIHGGKWAPEVKVNINTFHIRNIFHRRSTFFYLLLFVRNIRRIRILFHCASRIGSARIEPTEWQNDLLGLYSVG